jgi:hypothetical protein
LKCGIFSQAQKCEKLEESGLREARLGKKEGCREWKMQTRGVRGGCWRTNSLLAFPALGWLKGDPSFLFLLQPQIKIKYLSFLDSNRQLAMRLQL